MTAKAKSADNGKFRPVTLEHLAGTLAEERSLSRRHNQALLEDLIGLTARLTTRGLAFCRCESVLPPGSS